MAADHKAAAIGMSWPRDPALHEQVPVHEGSPGEAPPDQTV